MSRFRLSAIAGHPVSLPGAIFVTVSAILFLALAVLEAAGFFSTPYFGLVLYVALPAAFILGLLLIPVGLWLQARRRRSAG
jgi:hypothetical protein